MILPRQARDTHRENSKNSGVSSSGRGSGRASGDDEEDAADGASREVRGGGLTETGCETRHFLSHLYISTNFLPRQARDRHRENSKTEWRFLRWTDLGGRGCRHAPSSNSIESIPTDHSSFTFSSLTFHNIVQSLPIAACLDKLAVLPSLATYCLSRFTIYYTTVRGGSISRAVRPIRLRSRFSLPSWSTRRCCIHANTCEIDVSYHEVCGRNQAE
jgi:hypothetical protein